MSKQQKDKDLAQKYKMVFGTEEGKAVMIDILTDCHVGVRRCVYK